MATYVLEPSSLMIRYEGSGGVNASFDTICDGNGGQQNRQHKYRSDTRVCVVPPAVGSPVCPLALPDC